MSSDSEQRGGVESRTVENWGWVIGGRDGYLDVTQSAFNHNYNTLRKEI